MNDYGTQFYANGPIQVSPEDAWTNPFIQNTFGTFDNYLAYLESVGDVPNWGEAQGITGGSQAQQTREDDDLWGDTNNDLTQSGINAQQSAYNTWLNSPENQALMQQYGIAPVLHNSDGDKFLWDGSTYQMVDKVDDHMGVMDWGKTALITGIGLAVGQPLAGALQGAGMGATAASAASAGLVNSASQLALTGDLDFSEALRAAATAGLTTEAVNYLNDNGFFDEVGSFVDQASGDATEYFVLTPEGDMVPVNRFSQEMLEQIAAGNLSGHSIEVAQNSLSLPDWAFDGAGGVAGLIDGTIGGIGQSPTTPPTFSNIDEPEGDIFEDTTEDTVQDVEQEPVTQEPVEQGNNVRPGLPSENEEVFFNPFDILQGINFGDGSDPEQPTDNFTPFPGQTIDPDYNDGEDDSPVTPVQPIETPPSLSAGGMLSEGSDDNPVWGELFPYTRISGPQKAVLRPYIDYIKKARGMLA